MRISEVAAELIVDALPRLEDGPDFERVEPGFAAEEVQRCAHGVAQDAFAVAEFVAVVGDELGEGRAVGGIDSCKSAGHFGNVLGCVDGVVGAGAGLATKDEAIHRIEAAEIDVVAQALASGGENFVEDVGHHEKGGAAVEGEVASGNLGGTAADARCGFVDGDIEAGSGEEDCGGEAAWAGADDGDGGGGGGVVHVMHGGWRRNGGKSRNFAGSDKDPLS